MSDISVPLNLNSGLLMKLTRPNIEHKHWLLQLQLSQKYKLGQMCTFPDKIWNILGSWSLLPNEQLDGNYQVMTEITGCHIKLSNIWYCRCQ